MNYQSIPSNAVLNWDSTAYQNHPRARVHALENVLSHCNTASKVSNKQVKVSLRYRLMDHYRFAEAEYEDYHSYRSQQDTEADNTHINLILINKVQALLKTDTCEALLNEGDFVLATEKAIGEFQTIGVTNLQAVILPSHTIVGDQTLRRHNNLLVYQQPSGAGSFLADHLKKLFKEQITRFNNEYDFTKGLSIHGVRKALRKDKIDGKNTLILEQLAELEKVESTPEELNARFERFIQGSGENPQEVFDRFKGREHELTGMLQREVIMEKILDHLLEKVSYKEIEEEAKPETEAAAE